ncbi:MAG: hypothetical protein P8M80_02635 [Pirellulaceae bacterium]|nr:hypothetical protein [Pirellulaceae bacterium]
MVLKSIHFDSDPALQGGSSTVSRDLHRSVNQGIHTWPTSSRRVPAWLLSAILHFGLVVILAIIVRPEKKGGVQEAERKGGIVLVKETPTRTEYFDPQEDSKEEATAESSRSAIHQSLPTLNELDEDLPNFLPTDDDLGQIGAELGRDLTGADGFLDGIGTGNRQANSNAVTTEIFGVQGKGTTFVYVFDRSGSMESFGGRPLLAAKAELISSLDSLGPDQQFQIVFYNERPRAFTTDGGRPRLMVANVENKKRAKKFALGISGGGATEHFSALKMAVDFGPDVVFFLTDAADPGLSEREMDVVDRMNRNAASIHTIEFGYATSSVQGNFLMQLARRNGGQYVYKNVTHFVDRK